MSDLIIQNCKKFDIEKALDNAGLNYQYVCGDDIYTLVIKIIDEQKPSELENAIDDVAFEITHNRGRPNDQVKAKIALRLNNLINIIIKEAKK